VPVGPNDIYGSKLTEIGQKLTLLTPMGPLTLASVLVGPMASMGSMLTEIWQKLTLLTHVGPLTLA
jgi:hypothetical protein